MKEITKEDLASIIPSVNIDEQCDELIQKIRKILGDNKTIILFKKTIKSIKNEKKQPKRGPGRPKRQGIDFQNRIDGIIMIYSLIYSNPKRYKNSKGEMYVTQEEVITDVLEYLKNNKIKSSKGTDYTEKTVKSYLKRRQKFIVRQ